MKTWRVLALLSVLAAPATAADIAAMNAAAVERHILPSYAALSVATATLEKVASASCADRAALQAAWRGAMIAWQGAQHLRFGPGEWFDRRARFAFWPDPRNVASRQLAELFDTRDPEALTSERFLRGSVSTQGLGALERVLFDEPEFSKLQQDAFRCHWLAAIASNLAAMAREIDDAWRTPPVAFGRQFIAAQGPNISYHAAEEALVDLFKSLHVAVELVADHKLARPLGESAANARPRLAENWRSGASLEGIRANIAAAEALYAALRPEIADVALAAEVTRRFAGLREAAAGIALPLEKAVADPAARLAVDRLRRDASLLKAVLAERLTLALGISLGFNALDGD
jgi:predicted lipoprotein